MATQPQTHHDHLLHALRRHRNRLEALREHHRRTAQETPPLIASADSSGQPAEAPPSEASQ